MTAEEFITYRPLLFAIAYRMIGRVSRAEELIQDTWLEAMQSRADIKSPRNWLTTTLTRRCIDELRSAQKRREEYVGTWLPEPILVDPMELPDSHVELDESLSMAFLLVLERLSPPQRAAFLLRDVFDYDYPDIALIIGHSPASVRQLVSRARAAVKADKPTFDPPSAARDQLIRAFAAAVYSGDLRTLESILAKDAALYSDGGGKVAAARKIIRSARSVSRALVGLAHKHLPKGAQVAPQTINGQAGVIVFANGGPYAVYSFEVVSGRIGSLRAVLNPDKLLHLTG